MEYRGFVVFVRLVVKVFVKVKISARNVVRNCLLKNFKVVFKDGGHSFDLPPTWSEIIIDDKIRKMRFMQGLKELERTCNIKDNTILKIMREQFIKTCFEG